VSLLRDIQADAMSSGTPVSDILLKLKVLAVRLSNPELAEWAEHELNGYPDAAGLPPYRKADCECRGSFMNSALHAPSLPIGSFTIPDEEDRKFLFTIRFVDGVSEYQELLATGETQFQNPWSPEAVLLFGSNLRPGMGCISAWRVVSRGAVAGLLTAVRSRALDFCLALEQEDPDAGESGIGQTSVSPETVNQIFNLTISGGQNTIAAGSRQVTQSPTQLMAAGSVPALRGHLASLGLPDEDIDDLAAAIEEDRAAGQVAEPGSRVRAWLSRITLALAGGAMVVGEKVTGDTLAAALVQHYGLK
jgi:AbiTii